MLSEQLTNPDQPNEELSFIVLKNRLVYSLRAVYIVRVPLDEEEGKVIYVLSVRLDADTMTRAFFETLEAAKDKFHEAFKPKAWPFKVEDKWSDFGNSFEEVWMWIQSSDLDLEQLEEVAFTDVEQHLKSLMPPPEYVMYYERRFKSGQKA